MAQDITTPPDTELIRQGASRIRELKVDLMAGYYIPTGTVLPFAGSVAPAAWLVCDGSAISRTTYAALFTAIGTTWGAGDGSTTFNIPDLRGRAIIGVGTGAGLSARALAATGGEETHILTTGEMPTHSHSITDPGHGHSIPDPTHSHNLTDPGHSHTEKGNTTGGAGQTGVNAQANNGGQNNSTSSTASATTGATVASASTGITTASGNTTGITEATAGSGSAHNNMQPFAVLNYMIKAF